MTSQNGTARLDGKKRRKGCGGEGFSQSVISVAPVAREAMRCGQNTLNKFDKATSSCRIPSQGPVLGRRSSDEDCAKSHRLKWDSLPPNDVGRIAQYIMEGEGRKTGEGSQTKACCPWSHELQQKASC